MSTYGEQAVGLSFNPSNNSDVEKVKRLFAKIIDICSDGRAMSIDEEHIRLFSTAITAAQGAQMWAVKAITWNLPSN
jgi:hypothetical protein